MRIGFLPKTDVPNQFYRAVFPADALHRRGHEVLIEGNETAKLALRHLRRCDVVHFFRRADAEAAAFAADLQQHGVAVTWDDDDDVRLLPPDSRRNIGVRQADLERIFARQAKLIHRADLVTTTSAYLADRYREAGAARVVDIENYLHPSQIAKQTRGGDGLVIGWVAGREHDADVTALGITDMLHGVLERHPKARVVTVGLRLELDHSRYVHNPGVPLLKLREIIKDFDIAIAPLADTSMSQARSNVKVKEYAAAGVPWLASARGPYAGLGPAEGGRLVADDQWPQALDDLVSSRLKRAGLRRHARAWGRTQAIDDHVHRWIEAFEEAVDRAAARRAQRLRPASGGGARARR